MLRADLLKPDLLSKAVLLGSGALLFGSLLLVVVTASGERDRIGFFGGYMPPTVQVGAILTNESSLMMQSFGLETAPCSGNWSLVKVMDGFALDRKIHAAGWNFFFMAAEVKVMFFGALGAQKIQNALQKILGKVKQQNFNGIEITGIVAKRFLGVPYAVVTAHSRHVQPGCYLDSAEARRASRHNA